MQFTMILLALAATGFATPVARGPGGFGRHGAAGAAPPAASAGSPAPTATNAAVPPASSAPARPPPASSAASPPASSSAATSPAAGGVDPSLVPQFGITPDTNPQNGVCDGANGVKIPCNCPPDRSAFIAQLNKFVAAGKTPANAATPFPTDNSVASQKTRIETSLVTLQSFTGVAGVGCPGTSTTFAAQTAALGN